MNSIITLHADIVRLAKCYAKARQISMSTLARQITGSSTWFERCGDGRVTIRSAVAVVRWLSEHWPQEIAWPDDIPHPSPCGKLGASASNGARSSPGIAGTLPGTVPGRSSVEEAGVTGTGNGHDAAARETEIQSTGAVGQSMAAAMRLGPARQIASPMELCKALGVSRYVYDDVVRRYRDEIGAGRRPRPGSECGRMLSALVAAGDARFTSRRQRPEPDSATN